MKQIGKTIIESGININLEHKNRSTIRAVIIRDNKVLMLYSSLYNDYTFPGGGIKASETHIDALIRELNEELGAINVDIIKPLGYTLEYRYGINSNDSIYLQKSYFYLVNTKITEQPQFIGREKEQGLHAIYVNPEEIIHHNNKINTTRGKGFKTVLIRENIILNYILKHLI